MTAKYRVAQPDDIHDLVMLMEQLGYQHNTESLEKNIASVRHAGGEIFVTDVENQVCGCVAAILDARLAAGVQGEIVSLVVLQEYRGRGLGAGLVNSAEQWLIEKVDKVRIRANSLRSDAPKFYQQQGYTLSKTQNVFHKQLPARD